MSAKTKVDGVWRDVVAPYVKVAGSWKFAKSSWIKLNGRWKSWFLQGGALGDPIGGEDNLQYPNFMTNAGFGANASIRTMALQSDGKLLIGGSFTTFNGTSANNIIRLNLDGTIDTAFMSNVGTGASRSTGSPGIWSIVIQPDNKILVGGEFSGFNGAAVNRIVRLNSDGTRDTSFAASTSTDIRNTILCIAIQQDGKILVGSSLTTPRLSLVRLNADGTRDIDFTTNGGTGAIGSVQAIAIQSDGKVVIGGTFTTFNEVTVNRIVRLNTNGTLDTGFLANTGTGVNSDIDSIAIQPDNKILIGGLFTTFNGATVNRIVRLNQDGTRDVAFTNNNGTGFNSSVLSLVIQPDGKILAGGFFNGFHNGFSTSGYRIARMNPDGTSDTSFRSNISDGSSIGANSSVRSIALRPNGEIIIGGDFTSFRQLDVQRIFSLGPSGSPMPAPGASSRVRAISVQGDGKILLGGDFSYFNNTLVNRFIRVDSDGAIDPTFNRVISNFGPGFPGGNFNVLDIKIQPDNKILVGGTFFLSPETYFVRLNQDGTKDTQFTENINTGADNRVSAIALQSDNKILLGGAFSTFNGVGANRVIRLNTNGTIDTDFTANIGSGLEDEITTIALQPDNKILLGGRFTTFNGATVNRIVRLNQDGTRDTAFSSNVGTGADNDINSVASQSNGRILVGGLFTTFNGVSSNRIVALNQDGTRDTAFSSNVGTGADGQVLKVSSQPDNKILIGGLFTTFNGATVNRIVRLNQDGTRDTAFSANVGAGISGHGLASISEINPNADGNILLGGNFTTFDGQLRYRVAKIGGGYQPLFSADYLVIAGGGGGGGAALPSGNSPIAAGGGGAGGYRSSVAGQLSGAGSNAETPQHKISVNTPYPVSVGVGGAGGVRSTSGNGGSSGTNSIFSTIVAIGGGGGGAGGLSGTPAKSGGSGGGASGSGSPSHVFAGGSGTVRQGQRGVGQAGTGEGCGGRGGGGSLGTFSDSSTISGTPGGAGTFSSITGFDVQRAGGGGGGGGGCGDTSTGGNGGHGGGGRGGGRSGGTSPIFFDALPGTANTGGGGGGGGSIDGSQGDGRPGGSGVVILRYPSSYTIAIGAGLVGSTDTTSVPGFKITTLTQGSGNVSWALS
jgi:uncharacterized delta-60 repeat protein